MNIFKEPDVLAKLANDRVFQTLIIICLIACGWLLVITSFPQEQYHYIKFGSAAQLISVTPYSEEAIAGKSIKFKVKWRLLAPLPPDKVIAYYLGNPNYSPLAGIDTKQPSNGGEAYTEVALEGRLFTDIVELKIPKDVKPGPYEVSTFIWPPNQFELNAAHTSPASLAHRTLFIVHIKNDS